ncbi:MAG TPA: transporter substrate-binding domain-containing protein [Streptosporangiaceae bacterium]|nr:transporter substrate-binding domain-containing protein [Streptosporangiaceae bacterium]
MRATRDAAIVVIAALAVLVAVVAYRAGDAAVSSVADKDTLVIGVEDDKPGLGTRTPAGTFTGFEVDVATYVAGRLGVSEGALRFVAIHPGDWERALRRGEVDLVFAGYPITPQLADRVTVAGPYYVAHQSILVRADDKSIQNVRDLRGKRLCQVAGTRAADHIIEDLDVAAVPVPAPSYADCAQRLAGKDLDAVSADDLILAGIAATVSDSAVVIVNAPFTDERYGVGLQKGDIRGCAAVNRAITEMYQSGAANTMLTQGFGSPGLSRVTGTAPSFEGCA